MICNSGRSVNRWKAKIRRKYVVELLSYQSVMNIVLVILLLLMLGNMYACSLTVLSTNTVTTQLYF